jgi:hypothetical protein
MNPIFPKAFRVKFVNTYAMSLIVKASSVMKPKDLWIKRIGEVDGGFSEY